MFAHRSIIFCGAAVLAAAVSLAACGGGGSGGTATVPGGGGGGVATTPTPTPVPTSTPTGALPQVVQMALPTSSIGSEVDPTYGLIGGFTQQTYSQTLGYAPGAQIMIRNSDSTTPHTFGVVSTTSFGGGAALSLSATGGSTVGSGFNTGTVNSGATMGPFTLASGTYYIGCAYHYVSNNMRTVLVVAPNAAPGPQATPPASSTPAPPGYY